MLIESIWSELIIAKQKCICFSIYCRPKYSNFTTTFYEITNTFSKSLLRYESIILMGDCNINNKCKDIGTDKLEELCDVFNLKNLVKFKTCFTKVLKSLIDLVVTSKPL